MRFADFKWSVEPTPDTSAASGVVVGRHPDREVHVHMLSDGRPGEVLWMGVPVSLRERAGAVLGIHDLAGLAMTSLQLPLYKPLEPHHRSQLLGELVRLLALSKTGGT